MIKAYTKQGQRNFVVSSSGNAALASILATTQHNKNNPTKQITLTILVGQHVDTEKHKRLSSAIADVSQIELRQVERPKQEAFQMGKNGDATYLRQSTDDLALEGYLSLAQEMGKIPDLRAIFVPTSSGTCAQAIANYFTGLENSPEIHIVQTAFCHPIAELCLPEGVTPPDNDERSIAGAIVDKVAHRKTLLSSAVLASGGAGWIPNEEVIEQAVAAIKANTDITKVTPNGALGLAGIMQTSEHNKTWDGPVAALICGA